MVAAGGAGHRLWLRLDFACAGRAEPAGDLSGALERQGVTARRLVLYETDPVRLEPEAADILVRSDLVLLHSARAAKVLAGVVKAHPAPGLRVLGLSKAVLRPLARARLGPKAFPPFPLEAGLLNLIDRS